MVTIVRAWKALMVRVSTHSKPIYRLFQCLTIHVSMPETIQFLACSGMRRWRNSSGTFASSAFVLFSILATVMIYYHLIKNGNFTTILPWGVKLNNGGSGRPFGRLVFGSRRSLKNGCAHAANCKQTIKTLQLEVVLVTNTCGFYFAQNINMWVSMTWCRVIENEIQMQRITFQKAN